MLKFIATRALLLIVFAIGLPVVAVMLMVEYWRHGRLPV